MIYPPALLCICPCVHASTSPFNSLPSYPPGSIKLCLSASPLLVPKLVLCLWWPSPSRHNWEPERWTWYAPNTAVQYARWMAAFRVIKPHIVTRTLYGLPAKSHKGKEKGISPVARARAAIYSVMEKRADSRPRSPSQILQWHFASRQSCLKFVTRRLLSFYVFLIYLFIYWYLYLFT
jgi:hypothetical protein